jgi:pilus assembly protein CpaB
MNRRNRTLVVLLVAVALASVATFLVYRTVSSMPVREVEVASVKVAVAAENLPLGTMLNKDHIKLVGWPASSPLTGAFATPEGLVGRGLIQGVNANEPLTESKLAPVEAGAGVAPTIPAGMRAMSVRVNEVVGVAGFVVPGSRVDVVLVLGGRDTSTMSRTVLSNVQVLTAGTKYDQEAAKNGQAIPSRVVTLLLTPDDAEKMALAETAGGITLVLRNPLDTLPTETKGARMAQLMGEPAPPPMVKKDDTGRPRVFTPKRPVADTPPPPQPYHVEAIRAAKRSEEVVKEAIIKQEGQIKEDPKKEDPKNEEDKKDKDEDNQ